MVELFTLHLPRDDDGIHLLTTEQGLMKRSVLVSNT